MKIIRGSDTSFLRLNIPLKIPDTQILNRSVRNLEYGGSKMTIFTIYFNLIKSDAV